MSANKTKTRIKATKKAGGVHRLADMPAGTLVHVALEGGASLPTRTKSDPWQLATGEWVVLLHAMTGPRRFSGGVTLDDVTPVDWEPAQ